MTFDHNQALSQAPAGHPEPAGRRDAGDGSGALRAGEITQFRRVCQTLGFAPDEFLVSAHDSVPAPGRKPGRVISVYRQQFGRDFATSAGTGWVADAVLAVRAGHFGKP